MGGLSYFRVAIVLIHAKLRASARSELPPMKLVAEYLERVAHFQRLAGTEKDPAVREQLLEQVEAYYKLAANRAKNLGQPIPPRPPSA